MRCQDNVTTQTTIQTCGAGGEHDVKVVVGRTRQHNGKGIGDGGRKVGDWRLETGDWTLGSGRKVGRDGGLHVGPDH